MHTTEEILLAECLSRIRAGDGSAAARFQREYDPLLTVIAQRSLRREPPRYVADPLDTTDSPAHSVQLVTRLRKWLLGRRRETIPLAFRPTQSGGR